MKTKEILLKMGITFTAIFAGNIMFTIAYLFYPVNSNFIKVFVGWIFMSSVPGFFVAILLLMYGIEIQNRKAKSRG
ncbi:MAG: hypothetical protein QNJ60_15030 [Xenococcaceae cyanobacterium MO_188.B19]|nr:hypothetical protein [Xenococcaceae cyanobacterium MO_188.B19]